MQEVESYQQVEVGYFELFQERQHHQQNQDSHQLSGHLDGDELFLVPAVSLPHVEIPELALSEGDVVHPRNIFIIINWRKTGKTDV